MTLLSRLKTCLLLALVPMLLIACGGGGGGGGAILPIIPPPVVQPEPIPEPTPPPVVISDPFKLLESSQRILFFYAHPDDETILAPEIAKLCGTRVCRMVYATRGGFPGDCFRDLCKDRDLEQVRSDELDKNAAHFGFEAIKWNWPTNKVFDGPAKPLTIWHGREADIQMAVEAFAPETIVTFSHEHGVTTQEIVALGEHVHLGEMVQRALKGRFDFNRIVLMEALLRMEPEAIGFVPAGDHAPVYTRWAGDEWEHVLFSMKNHASQFPDEWLRLVGEAPENRRAMSLSILGTR